MATILRGSDSFDTGTKYGIGGDGYAWVDETANRVAGTTYTNTTGHPIEVGIQTSGSANFIINGVTVQSGNGYGISKIIPVGATYSTPSTVSIWLELKYTGGV